MDTIIDNIKYRFKHAGVVEKTIYLNIALYVLTLMATVFAKWFGSNNNVIIQWFALSPNLDLFLTKPWTIVTYGIIHGGFLHILFNLILLFYIGNLFLEYFTAKQFIQFYVLGSLFGGILFLTSHNFIPLFKSSSYPLVGASAGILAIFIGIATHIPNYQLKIRFIGYVDLWKIAFVFIILDLIQLSGSNAGGHFAHLGGALFGFLYMNSLNGTKTDIFSKVTDQFKKEEKTPLKTVHNSGKKRVKPASLSKDENQRQVDIILDKIGKSGYDALSKEEKDFLFKQGKN